MAQAYEYKIVADTNGSTFASSLGTDDGDGWEVIGYATAWTGGSTTTLSALLRRRV